MAASLINYQKWQIKRKHEKGIQIWQNTHFGYNLETAAPVQKQEHIETVGTEAVVD